MTPDTPLLSTGMQSQRALAVLGSCVSRDTVEFGEHINVALYCARQSIAALAAPRLRADVLSKLILSPGIGTFHQRCIEQDVTKSTLIRIGALSGEIPVIIDLIEERAPIARSPCGSLVTLSQTATLYSNLSDLVVEVIEPWSLQHLALFDAALPALAHTLRQRQVVILRAFFAEDKRSYPQINAALERFYDRLGTALPDAHIVEPSVDLRLGEENHCWGLGPYHYVDAYYQAAMTQVLQSLGWPAKLKLGFSRRKRPA